MLYIISNENHLKIYLSVHFLISFRISIYKTLMPTDVECSGHGTCHDGDCLCDPMYRGEACNVAACPNNCSEARGHGICRIEQER